jgi:SagB-type dehydrogenase family enzyme
MPGEFSKKFHSMVSDRSHVLVESPEFMEIMKKKIVNNKKPAPQYKEYPRFKKIILPRNFLSLGSLENSLKKRRSSREYRNDRSVKLEELSTLLYYTAGIHDIGDPYSEKNRRFYPTGGGFYSLELYLFIQESKGVEAGLYHYCVKDHSLELLSKEKKIFKDVKCGINRDCSWGKNAPVTIFIAASWTRVFMKYLNFGYRIILLEAGHLSQNLALTASALNIGCCNALAFYDKKINKAVDLDDNREYVLYAAFLGK